ncbi:uncharacterized protein LOC129721813 isoform X2 [Wyeomyia smithii]|uniref:uncharacterized protein LOC129721813 isoform X2 n=1 Tax=Wyeomyia smithii TaxID=174621 RepID=UPI002467FFD2|nr:uncharacterized protein LOC129721813 isoform X2 [Wyeomyia smithii]
MLIHLASYIILFFVSFYFKITNNEMETRIKKKGRSYQLSSERKSNVYAEIERSGISNSPLCPRILQKKSVESGFTIAAKIPQLMNETSLRATPSTNNLRTLKSMTKSINLFVADNTLNTCVPNYLNETNSDFFVIGIIGVQGTGKSTILNMLAASKDKNGSIDSTIFDASENVFPINKVFETRENIEFDEFKMYITHDRVILLDSAPVLMNKQKADFIGSELEDIKKISLLLNICHVLIVLQDEYHNLNFNRLFMHAMIQQHQKMIFSPEVLFLRNKWKQYSENHKWAPHDEILQFFCRRTKKDANNQINITYFPYLTASDPRTLNNILELRQRVFSKMIHSCFKNQEILTEKSWYQIVVNIVEKRRNNYFLKKRFALSPTTDH